MVQAKRMDDLLNTVFEHDPDVVSRLIAGEMILVPIRKNVGDMESIFTLNETGARVWELLDGQRSLEQVHQQMVREFDIEPGQAEQDLLELLESLLEIGVLVKKQA
jgi:Coenzyme PQQ synthesis protein D (PqqD)